MIVIIKNESGDPSMTQAPGGASAAPTARLSDARLHARGAIAGVILAPDDMTHGVPPDELERRLLEIGFVEGARFEILHLGLIGADPIAVRLNDMRVALRRRDARAIAVRLDTP
jgi:ferrous iron transport protein A